MCVCVVSGECIGEKYKGLAWDEDTVDGLERTLRLNKNLLDHFRVLAASNEETDEVSEEPQVLTCIFFFLIYN